MKAVDFLGKCREKVQFLLQKINSKISGLSMLCMGWRTCGFTVSRLWLQNAVWMVCAAGFLETYQHFFSRNTWGNRQDRAAGKSRGLFQSFYARMWQFYYNGEKVSQAMEEKPNWFCLAAACKLQTIIGYVCVQQGIYGTWMGLGAIVVSWYIWRLRLFEHKNTHLGPLAYKKKSEFSLMSSMLHFVLSSVASMGFMANALMSGSILCGFMLAASVVILAVAFCGYAGCYYSGEGKIPWYLRPCVRQRPSGFERVYRAAKSSDSNKKLGERYVKAWLSKARGSSRTSSKKPDEARNQEGLRYRY